MFGTQCQMITLVGVSFQFNYERKDFFCKQFYIDHVIIRGVKG